VNQLGRKLYHLLGGLSLVSLYYFLGRNQALLLYAVLFAIVLVLDIVRLKLPQVNRFIHDKFRSFIRLNEKRKITGTVSYILGIGLTFYFYREDIATLAICFLAFGDVAATTVGERYGKTKIGNKSVEGSIAFVAAAISGGMMLSLTGIPIMYGLVVIGAFIAAGVELLPLPVNDNLLIPLVSGGVMSLVVTVIG